MNRRPHPPRNQMALDLRRDPKVQLQVHDPAAVLQAIADLLLGALGEQVEDDVTPTTTTTTATERGSHELEDHV